jgi:hypothetical protein
VRALFSPSKEIAVLIAICALFSFVTNFVSFYFEPLLWGLLAIVGDTIVLATLAVSWHRYLALKSGHAVAILQTGAGWRYVVGWLAIGVVTSILAAFFATVLYWVFGADPVNFAMGITGVSGLLAYDVNIVMFGALFLMLIWGMCYVTLRISVVLPYRAINSIMIGWREGWHITRNISGAIWCAAAVTCAALAFQMIVLTLLESGLETEVLDEESYDLVYSTVGMLTNSAWAAFMSSISWVLTVLIGAGTLTQIYLAADTTVLKTKAPLNEQENPVQSS